MSIGSNRRGGSARKVSLAIIAVLYLAAFGTGAAVFFLVPGDPVVRAFLADVAMTVLVYLASIPLANASVYDPYWSVVPPYLLILAAIDAGSFGPEVAMLLFALAAWSVRLTWNWASLWTDFSEQDWRYDMLRRQTKKLWPLVSFLGVMLFPTLIVFAQLVGAIRLAYADGNTALAYGGASIVLLGAFLQWLADRQMASFRRRNAGRKECIEEGLWRYSRHPNYFGEVLVWWGVFLAASGTVAPYSLHLAAPVAMTCMFLFLSIPMMERKILATRPAYAAYRRRVSTLVPFFRRPEAEPEAERTE